MQSLALSSPNSDGKRIVIRLRCKQWSCPECAAINKRMWRGHLASAMDRVGGFWSMLTVTADGDDHRDGTTLDAIMNNWDRLMKRLKRSYGAFEYVRIYERHKSGAFHVHMLINYFPDDAKNDTMIKWVRRRKVTPKGVKWIMTRKYRGAAYDALLEAAVGCDLGKQVDYSPVMNWNKDGAAPVHAAMAYISKYMTKSVGGEMPKGTRRIQTSRGIGAPKIPTESALQWQIKAWITLDDVMESHIVDGRTGERLTTDEFMIYDVWPSEWLTMEKPDI